MTQPDLQQTPASNDGNTLPRINLDSLEDFEHISTYIVSVFDQFDQDEMRQVLGPLISQLKEQFPDKEIDVDQLFAEMKQPMMQSWVEPVLTRIKANVSVRGTPYHQCTDVEPKSIELSERLRKLVSERDESLRQVTGMRITHPENYESMMHDFVRLERKMNVDSGPSKVDVATLNPVGPPRQDMIRQGIKDLEDALADAENALKPVK